MGRSDNRVVAQVDAPVLPIPVPEDEVPVVPQEDGVIDVLEEDRGIAVEG